ncbi:MAG: alpha/beta hydrolase [Acidimicrobiia bacterium]|nr:alpha/beta hydrolase [Acidimicrobiia bacterium]
MPSDTRLPKSTTVAVSPLVDLRVIQRQGGSGLPFLLVHGLASNARLWDGVAEHLAAAGHNSAAVDLRGHGESSQVSEGYDWATLAADLAEVLNSLGWESAIVAGQSWGANVTLEFAARHPERVTALSLIDGGFLRLRDDLPEWPEARRMLSPPSFNGMTMESLAAAMRVRLQSFPEKAIEAQLANLTVDENGSVRNRLSFDNHIAILRHLWEHDPDPVGAEVSIPVQVIAVSGGSPSKPVRVSSFAETSGAEIHWMDGHHDVHAQQPERVAALLLNLVERSTS